MLDRLSKKPGSTRPRRRVGRGMGSGHGKTCGRGTKGAGARSGSRKRKWFEGGQMPLSRRVPKFGFTNIFAAAPAQIVNLKDLGRFEDGAVIDAEALAAAGLVKRVDHPVKVLSEGELAVRLTLRVNAVSASARAKVETAGGSVEIVERGGQKTEVTGQ